MSNKPAILMVDDEPSCLQVLNAALSGTDYQLICAVKAADALKLARERRPHLVLLDVMMPEMDGFTMCRQLREEAVTKDLAIIFLSSLQDPQDRTRGIELGAVDFITKPFDPAEVRARVRRQVELQEERRRFMTAALSPEQLIKQIISEGENDRTEFKSTLRWSLKENKINHGVEIIECSPASKPVFLIDAGQEFFYVRAGPGTRKLTMSEMLAYVVERGRI